MSKDLFLMMREQEVQTQNFLPSKKEIQSSSKDFITEVLDDGESDKVFLFSQAKRMNDALEVVTEQLLKSLPQENFEAFGLKGTYRNGGESINYKDDPVWLSLQKAMKDREELLKVALKSDSEIYDSEGVQVPKCSTTTRKSSLSITY